MQQQGPHSRHALTSITSVCLGCVRSLAIASAVFKLKEYERLAFRAAGAVTVALDAGAAAAPAFFFSNRLGNRSTLYGALDCAAEKVLNQQRKSMSAPFARWDFAVLLGMLRH